MNNLDFIHRVRQNKQVVENQLTSLKVPPPPDTQPIPEDTVRRYHVTNTANIPSILQHGLRLTYAQGIEGPKAIYSWKTWREAKNYGFGENRVIVEFYVDKHAFDTHAQASWVEIPPEQILAIHEYWHNIFRYAQEHGFDADRLKKVKDPGYQKAANALKYYQQNLTESRFSDPDVRYADLERKAKAGNKRAEAEAQKMVDVRARRLRLEKFDLTMVRGQRRVFIGSFPNEYRARVVANHLDWDRSWKPEITQKKKPAFTYYDDGSLIPLSQRFKPSSTDMKESQDLTEEMVTKLTPEMIAWFETRTRRHIKLVQKYARKIAKMFPEYEQVVHEVQDHDHTKFEEPERIPYIFMSWRLAHPEDWYSDSIANIAHKATIHHVRNNSHHPEYWASNFSERSINKEMAKDFNARNRPPEEPVNVQKMPELALVELCADWAAMSEEFGGSPIEWATRNFDKRWIFTDEQKTLILKILNVIWDGQKLVQENHTSIYLTQTDVKDGFTSTSKTRKLESPKAYQVYRKAIKQSSRSKLNESPVIEVERDDLSPEWEGWVRNKGGSFNYETGRWDFDRDINLSYRRLNHLPLSFGHVGGYFYCGGNQLTSLEGAPQSVGGSFYCNDNQLTSLEGAPQNVDGDFVCHYNQLTSLEGAPQSVGGDFYCNVNQLTSLEGAPQNVDGDFYCGVNPRLPQEEIQRYRDSGAVQGNIYDEDEDSDEDDDYDDEDYDEDDDYEESRKRSSQNRLNESPVIEVEEEELSPEWEEWVRNKGGSFNYETGRWDFDRDIDLSRMRLNHLPLSFGHVGGGFFCYNNQLTSLEGAPQSVGRSFYCHDNHLTSLEGAPQSVDGDFYCYDNQLTSLEGAPQSVDGGFSCSYNQLTSLEGAPQSIGGYFVCHYNQLTSLEGAPQSVNGAFSCSHNQLTSLEGAPQSVGGYFDCSGNPQLPQEEIQRYRDSGAVQEIIMESRKRSSRSKLNESPVIEVEEEELSPKWEEWVRNKGGSFNYETGRWDFDRDIDLSGKRLKHLPLSFGHVGGYFSCSNNQLTSLKGAPQSVDGGFSCSYNQLTSLEGAPQSVGGAFSCSYNQLTSLESAPQSVDGNFYCYDNELTSLEGAPQSIGGDFYCSNNPQLPREEIQRYRDSGAVRGKIVESIQHPQPDCKSFKRTHWKKVNTSNSIKVPFQESIERAQKAYEPFRKNWKKVSIPGDLNLPSGITAEIYLFPNPNADEDSYEYRGFCVYLYEKERLVGLFHAFLDLDQGWLNDAEIDETRQKRGLGKILLILAISTGQEYMGGFGTDVRGITPHQERVYQWLEDSGILLNHGELDYDKVNAFFTSYQIQESAKNRKLNCVDIEESVDLPLLYHFTGVTQLLSMLKTDQIHGAINGISFTRDQNGWKHLKGLAGHSVCLIFDRNKLASRYKIEPYQDFTTNDDEMEEYIPTRSIPNLHRYITKIQLLFPHNWQFKWYDIQKINRLMGKGTMVSLPDDEFSPEILKEYLESKGYVVEFVHYSPEKRHYPIRREYESRESKYLEAIDRGGVKRSRYWFRYIPEAFLNQVLENGLDPDPAYAEYGGAMYRRLYGVTTPIFVTRERTGMWGWHGNVLLKIDTQGLRMVPDFAAIDEEWGDQLEETNKVIYTEWERGKQDPVYEEELTEEDLKDPAIMNFLISLNNETAAGVIDHISPDRISVVSKSVTQFGLPVPPEELT